jgi:EAL domain-containing protein (putative c-di-GMP-specific phosphodiesterase class I)
VVRGVIDLSRAMGFTCIAEGVEQEVQRHILEELGCDFLQGYLFGRPVNHADASHQFDRLRLGTLALLTGHP